MKTQKRISWLSLVLLALIAVIVIAFAVNHFISTVNSSSKMVVDDTYDVSYSIDSASHSGYVSATWMNAQGGIEQISELELPMKPIHLTMRAGDVASVSAQDIIGMGSLLTCKIFVDGVEFRSSSSQGNYVVATCQGMIGQP